MRRHFGEGSGGGGDAIFTVEDLWRFHGRRLARLVDRLLESPDDASAACYATLLRAAEHIDLTGASVSSTRAWWWLEHLGRDVCAEIRDRGVAPAWDTGALPQAIPERLRLRGWLLRHEAAAPPSDGPVARARRRDRTRWRMVFERKLRDLPVVVALPDVARRAAAAAGRAARGAWRRTETAVPAGMPTQRVAGMLAASPGVLEAAAAVTVALAMGAGAAQPAPHPTPVAVVERADLVSLPRLPEPEPEPVEVETAAPAPEPSASPPRAAVEPDPEPPPAAEPAPDPGPVRVTVSADPTGPVGEPVKEESIDGGRRYHTPSERVDVDVDDDGEEEAFVTTPPVGWHCPNDPDERGPASVYVCPVMEDSDMQYHPTA